MVRHAIWNEYGNRMHYGSGVGHNISPTFSVRCTSQQYFELVHKVCNDVVTVENISKMINPVAYFVKVKD